MSELPKRLLMMDVDSTLIQEEVIDLLATHAGVGEQVSAITESAMRGNLDFSDSLNERVALLKGLPAEVLNEIRTDIHFSKGARTLVATLKAHGVKVGVVSGGFIEVVRGLAFELELDFSRANSLEVVDGYLTGRTIGPIIDRPAKAIALAEFAAEHSIPLAATVAAGDGANDLGMLESAGLGIAFGAKPKVQELADIAINSGQLDEILFHFGIPEAEWIRIHD